MIKSVFRKTHLKKFISIFLIISITMPIVALADESEELATPVTSIEGQNDTEVMGLGYSEEQIESYLNCGFDINAYEAFLAEIGVQVVNGDIIVETVEQFKAIAKYKKAYDAEVGVKYLDRTSNTLLLSYNISLLSAQSDLVYGVLEKNQAIYPFPFQNDVYNATFTNARNSISNNCLLIADSHNLENFRINSPFVFNKKLRDDIAVIEDASIYYASITQSAAKKDLISYAERQENMRAFYLYEESSFPYSLDELPGGARASIYYSLNDCLTIIMRGGVYLTPLASAIFSTDETTKSFDTVQPQIDAFDDYIASVNN